MGGREGSTKTFSKEVTFELITNEKLRETINSRFKV